MAGISNINNNNLNTMISYNGHGMIEKYPANLTIAGVMSHELGHLNEARLKSVMTGDEIVSQDIDLNLQFVDGRMIATGGLATTVTSKNAEKLKKYQEMNPANFNKNNDQSSQNVSGVLSKNTLNQFYESSQSNSKPSENAALRLQRYKSQIEGEIRRLENLGSDILTANTVETAVKPPVNYETANETGTEDKSEAQQQSAKKREDLRVANLKKQLAKIENMISLINAAKTGERMEKLITDVVKANFGIAFDMAGLAAKSSVESLGTNMISLPESDKQFLSNAEAAPVSQSLNSNKKNDTSKIGAKIENIISMVEQSMTGTFLDVRI